MGRDPANEKGRKMDFAGKWRVTEMDGTLCGHIFFHHGDDSGLRAVSARKEATGRRNAASPPKAKRGG